MSSNFEISVGDLVEFDRPHTGVRYKVHITKLIDNFLDKPGFIGHCPSTGLDCGSTIDTIFSKEKKSKDQSKCSFCDNRKEK